ncbi:MAG: hypothetical protein JOZ31_24390 [Verrucomicrobia bacterium]|nr:hypothetical protein [Verrucomicrobiota bacterium]MBV8481496.1 hypothetical protein [Verrucomicrobiota bacterium]
MTDFIDTYRPLPPLSPADKIYIRGNFHTLEELCVSRPNQPEDCRSQIRAGLLPLPTYAVDGVEMYPADFFVFPDSAGGLGDRLKKQFFARYQRMAESYGQEIPEAQIAEEFASYLSGEYGVCLRWVTPETIFLKGLAMGKIDELLSEPNPGDIQWSAALRVWVNRLEAMEREFAPCDTARFGSLPSRVRYIDNVRAKFPDCFTVPAIREG